MNETPTDSPLLSDDEFDRCVLAEIENIRRIGRRLLGNRDDLDDFTQETLLHIYANRAKLREPERFSGWVAAIARNTALKWNRKKCPICPGILPDIPCSSPLQDERAEEKERWTAVLSAMASLNPTDRALLEAYYLEDASYEELQTRHGLSYESVNFRLSRARKRIRRQLRGWFSCVAVFFGLDIRRIWARILLMMLGKNVIRNGLIAAGVATFFCGIGVAVRWMNPPANPMESALVAPASPDEITGYFQNSSKLSADSDLPESESAATFEERELLAHRSPQPAEAEESDMASVPNQETTLPLSDAILPPTPEEAIHGILLDRWVNGYSRRDLSLYATAYWQDEFVYHSDNSTPDPRDDIEVYGFSTEGKSARRIFDRFDNINMTISDVRFEPVSSDAGSIRVHLRYQILLGYADNRENPQRASGESVLTFAKREKEWRIIRWDEYSDPQ